MAEKISKDKVGRERARLKRRIFTEIRNVLKKAYEQTGLTQNEIALKLGVDKGLISRRLNGQENLTLNTIADLFTAMEARLEMNGFLHSELEPVITACKTTIKNWGTSAQNEPISLMVIAPFEGYVGKALKQSHYCRFTIQSKYPYSYEGQEMIVNRAVTESEQSVEIHHTPVKSKTFSSRTVH